ncbi:MAG: CAP domain-containing protein, partial [Candidatus Baltobacteraceae bacterium]
SFNNELGTIPVTLLTLDQTNWLTQLNADRATWSAPPLVFDEILVEGARHWASYMAANGWYSQTCPASDTTCQNAVGFETAAGGTYTATGSNIDGEAPPSTWLTAEQRFMAEAARCPGPVNPATCPISAAPDFLNIVNPNFIWTGLAEAPHGKGYTIINPFVDYYDQEFATPIHQ